MQHNYSLVAFWEQVVDALLTKDGRYWQFHTGNMYGIAKYTVYQYVQSLPLCGIFVGATSCLLLSTCPPEL